MKFKITSLLFQCLLILFGVAYASTASRNTEPYASSEVLETIARSIPNMFNHLQSSNISSQNDFLYNPDIVPIMQDIKKKLSIFDRPITKNSQSTDNKTSNIVRKISECFESLTTVGKLTKNSDNVDIFQMLDSLKFLNSSSLREYIHNSSAKELHVKLDQKKNSPPPQQYILFELYTSLVSSQLKLLFIDIFQYYHEYVMIQNVTSEKLNNQIAMRLESAENSLREEHKVISELSGANRMIEVSEPKLLKRDVTFIELERVFQLTAYPLEKASFSGKCGSTCSELVSYEPQGDQCVNGICLPCEGRIKNCEGGYSVITCDPSDAESTRRHEWIETYGMFMRHPFDKETYGYEEHYGTSRSSNNKSSGSDCSGKLKTFGRYGVFPMCKFCVCTCEENMHYSDKSTFIISSRMVYADVLDNKVITGVRFKRENKIIYTQIKQGKLRPGGWIDESFNKWKPIEALDRKSINNEIEYNSKYQGKNLYKNFIVISEHVKTIDLDDVKCPHDDYVVTGVGFKVKKNENRIQLSIDCHYVNFEQGKIELNSTTSPLTSHRSRLHKKQQSRGLMPPDRVGAQNYTKTPIFMNSRYAEISMSDKRKDAGQSVLPWFDAQDIISDESMPLNAIGIYLRSSSESGGFFSYRLFSIDYSQFVKN